MPVGNMLKKCPNINISDGELGNVRTFMSRDENVAENSKKRENGPFLRPAQLFQLLCSEFLRARAENFTTSKST